MTGDPWHLCEVVLWPRRSGNEKEERKTIQDARDRTPFCKKGALSTEEEKSSTQKTTFSYCRGCILYTDKHPLNNERPILYTDMHPLNNERPILYTDIHPLNNERPILYTDKHPLNNERPILYTDMHPLNNERPILYTDKHPLNNERPILLSTNFQMWLIFIYFVRGTHKTPRGPACGNMSWVFYKLKAKWWS